MSMVAMMNDAKQRALDGLLGDRVEREERRAVTEWQAKVAAANALAARQAEEVANLARDESVAYAAMEKLRPKWKAVCNEYGYRRRLHQSRRYGASCELYDAKMAAENAAPEAIALLRRELCDERERTRRERIGEVSEPTGKVDKRGKPIMRTRSTGPAISGRVKAIGQLVERCDALRTMKVDDLPGELSKIRAAVPDAHYPLSK